MNKLRTRVIHKIILVFMIILFVANLVSWVLLPSRFSDNKNLIYLSVPSMIVIVVVLVDLFRRLYKANF